VRARDAGRMFLPNYFYCDVLSAASESSLNAS
jgi:hypothetical protein